MHWYVGFIAKTAKYSPLCYGDGPTNVIAINHCIKLTFSRIQGGISSMSYSQKDNSLTAQFCYSSTVDELVNKLRNNYAWDDAEVLPKWISAPLAKYPQLQAYTRKFMYFLRSTTTSFGNTKLNYYDVLVNCCLLYTSPSPRDA